MTSDLSPRDLALLLIAAQDRPPRQRARDQQADLAGLQLRRRVLQRLVDLDPAPDQLEAALLQIVDELGSPTGPTRAIATGLRDEWQAASADPDLLEHWLGEALNHRPERGRARD